MLQSRLSIYPPFPQLIFGNQEQIKWLKEAELKVQGKMPFEKADVLTGFTGFITSKDGYVDKPDNTVFVEFTCLFCKKRISIEFGYQPGTTPILERFYKIDAEEIDCGAPSCFHSYKIDRNNNVWAICSDD